MVNAVELDFFEIIFLSIQKFSELVGIVLLESMVVIKSLLLVKCKKTTFDFFLFCL